MSGQREHGYFWLAVGGWTIAHGDCPECDAAEEVAEYQLTYLGHVLDGFDTPGEANASRDDLVRRIKANQLPDFLDADDISGVSDFPIRRRRPGGASPGVHPGRQNPRSHPSMTKTEAVAEFAAEVLPGVLTAYGRHDRAALRTAWNDYADELAKSGRITERQAETWTQPDFARLIREWDQP